MKKFSFFTTFPCPPLSSTRGCFFLVSVPSSSSGSAGCQPSGSELDFSSPCYIMRHSHVCPGFQVKSPGGDSHLHTINRHLFSALVFHLVLTYLGISITPVTYSDLQISTLFPLEASTFLNRNTFCVSCSRDCNNAHQS